MSQEDVELVRLRFDAFNRGDFDASAELTDPNAVWWDRGDDLPGGGPHRGREACLQHVAEILEDDDLVDLQAHPDEIIDAGDSVVASIRLTGRGRASGVDFEEHEFHVFTLRDGKVTEQREYRERKEALKAVEPEE